MNRGARSWAADGRAGELWGQSRNAELQTKMQLEGASGVVPGRGPSRVPSAGRHAASRCL